MKKVLVTGAGGFIGSQLVENLLKKKFNVRAFIKYSSTNDLGWLKNIKNKNLEIFHGDISDYDSVHESFKNVEFVFNLAALISVPYSFKNPESFINTNVKGLLNVNDIIIEAQKTKITKSSDLNNVVNQVKKRGDKNLLLSVIDKNNQSRYLGVKLN